MRATQILAAALITFTAIFTGQSVHAGTLHNGAWVNVTPDRALYYEYHKPRPGHPTVVLLNGLTYRIGSWDRFVEALSGEGLGVLQYDMTGQGLTLLRYAPVLQPIALQDQIDDLGRLLNALGINEPVHLISLSYGGAVGIPFAAKYPNRVASLVLMAPFIAPLQKMDEWIRLQIQNTRLMFPQNPASDDELYDYFLHVMVMTTYPSAEPIVLENPFKLEATYRMVQGARKFYGRDFGPYLPAGKVHLMIAKQDQYIENSVHEKFWSQVAPQARASLLYIDGSEHKIPEAVPTFSAAWIKRIIHGDPQLQGGHAFLGRARDGVVTPL